MRRDRGLRGLWLMAVTGLVLAACGPALGRTAPGSPATHAAAASSSPTSTPIPSPAPASQNPPGLQPVACASGAPAGARCSTLWVPLDYSQRGRGTIPTSVIDIPATDPAGRIGPLLINPGGPGESGVQFVEEDYSLLRTLNQRFDLVGFDPRGTTGPDAVACESTAGLDHYVGADPFVDGSPVREADLVATSLAFADACSLHSGWLLPYLGTVNAARDMDALRAALGVPALTYLGFSYGTALGAEYLSLFPGHVRAMVLDGDIDPALSFTEASIQQGASFEASYQEFVAQCKAETSCPLGSDPDAIISSLLTDLAAHPVAIGGQTVGRGLALTALAAAMYDPTSWGLFYSAFSEASDGSMGGLEYLADTLVGRGPGGYDPSTEANAAINCADHAAPDSLAGYDSLARSVQATEPHFGQDEVYSMLPCTFWPFHGPAPAALHVTAAPPVLLVGATHDPATPYAWSQALQTQIAGSVLLTRDGYGHTSYPYSACVRSAVDAYLEQLTMPAAGTACPTG